MITIFHYFTNKAPASTDFGLLDLLFKYGDKDESDSLDYYEVKELFCGRIFSVNINDIMASIMKQDADEDNSIDRNGKTNGLFISILLLLLLLLMG